ncbi:hypothetical protein CQA16_25400, partial [Enterobacter hormaechei]
PSCCRKSLIGSMRQAGSSITMLLRRLPQRQDTMKMVWMAVPYTIVLAIVGLLSTTFLLPEVTHWLYAAGWIQHYDAAAAAAAATGH